MNEPTSNQTLDIQGTSYRKVGQKVGWGVALVGLGIGLFWWAIPINRFDLDSTGLVLGIFLTFSASSIFFGVWCFFPNEHTYLDFTDRRIVTLKHWLWFEPSRRCRPLTDFGTIVVRHLCHPGGEGPDTYTGSVGLKPVDGRAVLWVKSFPTTQDEVPRTTHEFARKLEEMTGLPVASLLAAGAKSLR